MNFRAALKKYGDKKLSNGETVAAAYNKYMPIAITERHVANSLVTDTKWINEVWDGTCQQMRVAIDNGDFEGRPYMLYGGSKEQRHELHKKLIGDFEHTSINMDDGSRIMVIINWPGWIYTDNDLAVCFFTSTPGTSSGCYLDDRLQAEARSIVVKIEPRDIAAFLPQQQYESKSAADERKDTAQTINKWRENVNRMIGHNS